MAQEMKTSLLETRLDLVVASSYSLLMYSLLAGAEEYVAVVETEAEEAGARMNK